MKKRTNCLSVKSSSHFLFLGGSSCLPLKVSSNTEIGAQGKAEQPGEREGKARKGGMTGTQN